MIPLELTLSKIHKELQRASRVLRTPVYTHSFSKGEKRGTQCTERLKWQEMSRSEKRTRFCKNYFLGKGFCKTSANVFEIRRGLNPARRRGLGRNPRGHFWRGKGLKPVKIFFILFNIFIISSKIKSFLISNSFFKKYWYCFVEPKIILLIFIPFLYFWCNKEKYFVGRG